MGPMMAMMEDNLNLKAALPELPVERLLSFEGDNLLGARTDVREGRSLATLPHIDSLLGGVSCQSK
jgi:hypothetical protein